ncbi:MAG: CPBP family intramembrane metalloprotease [Chloroflexota bacterium]|nr:MAG: CPBP family intramembrane metalloprotease [Chloroflexota bacterium]
MNGRPVGAGGLTPGSGPSRLRAFVAAFVNGPSYPAAAADRRTVNVLGLELPLRATTALVVVMLVLLFDFTRTAIPREVQDIGRAAQAVRYQAFERTILFGLVPALVIVLAFRDRLGGYGLGLGDWRWGAGLAVLGCAVMTPIVISLGSTDEFRAYYSISSAPVDYLVVTHLLDLIPAEFVIRGFLMFTLIRAIGPVGVVVALLPFVFAHLGKPEIELFSTVVGGSVFGWLNWRTGSIWWSSLGHVYILTLVVAVAGTAQG